MGAQIHVHPKIERKLTCLERQANAPALAAERARRIIHRLTRGISPSSAGLMRPRPDRRVKNSLKFNLGSGFRLICIREKSRIHIMFVGDHGSCDAWLDHHSKKKPHKHPLDADIFTIDTPCTDQTVQLPSPGLPNLAAASSDDQSLEQISQKSLRRVFRGICASG